MTLRKFTLIAAVIAACLAPTLSQAAIVTGSIVTINRINHHDGVGTDPVDPVVDLDDYTSDATYGSLSGGEFRVDGPGEVFKTFCLEYNEYINLPGNYQVTINKAAYYGGVGGATGSGTGSGGRKDTIGEITAVVYQAYRTSSLDGWNLTGSDFQYDSIVWADALQLLFWRAEGELDADYSLVGSSTTLVGSSTARGYADAIFAYLAKTGDLASGSNLDYYLGNSDVQKVKVLNLWDVGYPYGTTGQAHQSQLYYGDSPAQETEAVPEPASLVIWGAGLGIAGLVAARRRKLAKA